MNLERQKFLSTHAEAYLTDAERDEGWHFCYDWDGMLIHTSDVEFEACQCSFKARMEERRFNHGRAKLG
jgi:hypothetical protein